MEHLVTANLRSRPTRTAISILAVALGVIMMLIIGGITEGTLDDYLNRTIGVGADFILQPTGSSILYAFSSATLPEKLAQKLAEVPEISTVAPVLSMFSSSDFGLIFGIDLESYNRLPGRIEIVSGRESLQGYEVIVDELFAKARGVSPGMTIKILNHSFTISGICRSGAVVRIFVPIDTLQELNGTPDKATIMFIKAAPGKDVQGIYQELHRRYPQLSIVRTTDPSLLLADTRMPGLKEFRFTLVLVSMLLSFMVILLAMYTTIFERTREIGILKSLGASRSFIVGLILKESAMICVLGVLFGIGLSFALRQVIIGVFPTLQVRMAWSQLAFSCFLGLVGGILGALYPAYKASQMDPVTALSYE
jgi:putative ABC transport system permease protein